MEIGKVPNNILQKVILDKIKHHRKDILIRPKIGEDCCAVDFGEDACVLSTDPITGAVKDIGRLAVHVGCNDIASCGVEPLGILCTILAPRDTTEEDLSLVMTQICDTCDLLKVEVLGGHTEITDAVNKLVIITTSIGKVPNKSLVTTSGAVPGDMLIMTKAAGIEGTAIIANDLEEELAKKLDSHMIDEAKKFINHISVVKEGMVSLKVFNLLGQEVATLINENMTIGTYNTTFDGSKLASGTYIYELRSNGYSSTKKMMLMK